MDSYRSSSPFFPFKGKGDALRKLENISRERESIHLQMESLRDSWKDVIGIEGVSLVYFKQGAPVLRWRLSQSVHGKQRYTELFSVDSAIDLSDADDVTKEVLIGYESNRLLFNTRSRIAFNSEKSLRHYITAIDELSAICAQTATDGVNDTSSI